mgnify:CR=1 FL=1
MALHLPENWQVKYDSSHDAYLILDNNAAFTLAANYFSADFWRANESVINIAHGRGITYFVQLKDDIWVLREYLRGGLIAKLIKQHFFFTSLSATRAFQEIALLLKLRQDGVNVPKPIGGYIQKQSLWYTNKILLSAIQGAQEIHVLCRTGQLTKTICQDMGKEIAKMHNAGVYHHDLNIQNILKDEQDQIWLIDFDKCFSTKQLTQAQCQMNIARLHRSIEKKRKLHTDYVFTDKHWQALLDTYEDTLLIAS